MTTQGSFPIVIDAPPEAVWPWVAQIEKHAEWSPKPYRVQLVSGEPNAVGSKYRSVGAIPGDKEHENEVVITEVVPNERFALRAEDKQGSFSNTYVLKKTGAGTEVTYTLVFPKMKGAPALLVPIVFPLVGKADIRKRMNLLKAKVEASA